MLRGVAERASIRSRRQKAAFVSSFVRSHGIRTVLLVGVGQAWAPRWMIVEKAAAAGATWTAASDLWPTSNVPWPYIRADALSLPFADQAVDLVLSNAVVEHVGDEAAQRRFVAEHARVGRHWIITTPNRWFPVETHTLRPLLHWSGRWRAGREEFTRLLSRRELVDLVPPGSTISGRWYEPTFTAACCPPA